MAELSAITEPTSRFSANDSAAREDVKSMGSSMSDIARSNEISEISPFSDSIVTTKLRLV